MKAPCGELFSWVFRSILSGNPTPCRRMAAVCHAMPYWPEAFDSAQSGGIQLFIVLIFSIGHWMINMLPA